MINYSKLQIAVKTTLLSAGAVAVSVTLINGTTIPTVGLFDEGKAKNIDNRQNPSWLTGETTRVVMVPGIDFFGAVTSGMTTTPQVGGTVSWAQAGIQFNRKITSVATEMPVPNVPLMYTLGVG